MDRKRIARSFAVDRISNLPSDVTDQILKCLSLQEAVRTSVLSKEWRYKWTTIPHLFFNVKFYMSLRRKRDPESIINHVLEHHRGAVIEFSLNWVPIKSPHAIDHYLGFLSNHIIKYLTLNLSCMSCLYVMPHHFFSFDHLRHLSLHGVELRPPSSFKGFNRLVKLELVFVHVEAGEFKRFLSNCPLLEVLIMYDGTRFMRIDIPSPNLKSFHFWGQVSSFCFASTTIEEVSFLDYGVSEDLEMPELHGNGSNLTMVVDQVSSIRKLTCSNYFLQFLAIGGVPQKLPNNLEHLTILKFVVVDFGNIDAVASVLCLLRSSPNLQSLYITSAGLNGDSTGEPVIQYLKAQQTCEILLGCLKNVNIHDLSSSVAETEFVKLLLLAATTLEQVKIKCLYFKFANKRLVEELESFPRASPEALLIFN